MRPRHAPTLGLAVVVLLLVAGCGDGEQRASATVTASTVAYASPTPPVPPTATRKQPVPRRHPAASPTTDAAYSASLLALSRDLDTAIDAAARTGSSAAIAGVLQRLEATTRDWTSAGHPAGAGAEALTAAGQTARSAVESPLELDEARRQVAAARAALG